MKHLMTFEKFNSKHYVTAFPYPRKTTALEELIDDEKELEKKEKAESKKDSDEKSK